MYIEIRVQWTMHLGSSHMHVHAVTRVHAVTPKLVICVMYLTSIWNSICCLLLLKIDFYQFRPLIIDPVL